jgi:tol-pal system protein YbgF
MHKTGRLLLGSILAVVLMAPPASSQSTTERFNNLDRDVIDVKNAVKGMQDAFDTRNNELKGLLDQVLARFATIEDGMKKLNDSLSSMKATDEKTARDLETLRDNYRSLQTNVEGISKLNLSETLNNMNTQLGSIQTNVRALQNVEKPLPGAKEAFASASLYFNQGIWEIAASELGDFVRGYPKDPLAPSAQFMLGSTYLELKQPDKALLEFDGVIQNYAESGKVCSALYKKGQAHAQLKETTKAREAWQKTAKDCPGTEEAAHATDDLKKLPATPARGRGTQ